MIQNTDYKSCNTESNDTLLSVFILAKSKDNNFEFENIDIFIDDAIIKKMTSGIKIRLGGKKYGYKKRKGLK